MPTIVPVCRLQTALAVPLRVFWPRAYTGPKSSAIITAPGEKCGLRRRQRNATWDEIDEDEATWTLPAGRMKANREHRLPLSKRALEILAEVAEISDGSDLVFPGMRPGRPLSENTHSKMLRDLGFDAVTNGFRSSFRDYAAERTHMPHAVMEGGPCAHDQEQGRSRLRPKRSV